MRNKLSATILALPLIPPMLLAVAPKTQALLMAMGANGKQMAAYRWKQRTAVIRNGNPAATTLEELRFDATGQLQRTTLSKPEAKKMGPIRARKAAEVKEDVQEVMRLAGRYASPQQLSLAIQKGEIWEGQGSLRVQARYVILPSDEMTMVVDAASYLPARIDFKTQHEGRPVAIGIDYRPLPNGPSMMTRMTVHIPADNVVVEVESFDFVRLAVPDVP